MRNPRNHLQEVIGLSWFHLQFPPLPPNDAWPLVDKWCSKDYRTRLPLWSYSPLALLYLGWPMVGDSSCYSGIVTGKSYDCPKENTLNLSRASRRVSRCGNYFCWGAWLSILVIRYLSISCKHSSRDLPSTASR